MVTRTLPSNNSSTQIPNAGAPAAPCPNRANFATQFRTLRTRVHEAAVQRLRVAAQEHTTTRYYACQLLLFFLTPFVWTVNFFTWFARHFSFDDGQIQAIKDDLNSLIVGENRQPILDRLHAALDNLQHAQHATDKELILDFLIMDELHKDIHDLLKGANFVFSDQGRLYEIWSQRTGAYNRRCSHRLMPNTQAMGMGKTELFNEALFWRDEEGNTRLQLEKTPFDCSFANKLGHTMDALRYLRDGHQQGPFGTSPRIEDDPVEVIFEPWWFEHKRTYWQRVLDIRYN
jgi:hypothetical protein